MEETIENRINRNINNIVFSIFPNNTIYIIIYIIVTIIIIILSLVFIKFFINNNLNNLANKNLKNKKKIIKKIQFYNIALSIFIIIFCNILVISLAYSYKEKANKNLEIHLLNTKDHDALLKYDIILDNLENNIQ